MSDAAAVYRYLGVPVPTREKILVVDGIPADLQPEVIEGFLDKVALTVATAAMAEGCTKIVIRLPTRQSITLDLPELKTHAARELGFWPDASRAVPARSAVYDLWRMGMRFERTRPMVSVPAALTPGVSSDPGAGGG
jgi:hypothetical protein